MLENLDLDVNEIEAIEHAVKEMEREQNTDRESALVDMRYRFIEEACKECVTKAGETREFRRSVTLDNILTHKIWAFPTFIGIMFTVFYLTFNVIGITLSELLQEGIDALGELVGQGLEAIGLNPVIESLIIDGIFAGVGAVLAFLPFIVTLFFFLAILEDSGYMARLAHLADKPLRKIGLSGRSFVPMLMGFGCTVPALMATRTLVGDRDRKLTILLTPFMSCGAKIPVYALFTAAFFQRHQAFVMISLYLTGIVLGIFSAFIMKKTVFKGSAAPFVMELPNYRFPSIKSVLLLIWDRASDFIKRACTIILVATVIIWFLQSFDARLNYIPDNTDESMLAIVGQGLSAVFAAPGFSDWRAVTGLVTGFLAKEAVLSTLAILAGAGEAELGNALHRIFTPLSAFSYLVFILLYTPCVAAVAAMRREFGSLKGTILIVLYQTGFAWLVAAGVYQIGRVIGF
jgi:ferrous iron transport protein B